MKPTIALILAAGKGTRMRSELPKPIVPLNGKPIVRHLIDKFHEAGVSDIVLIVGYKSDEIKKTIGEDVYYIEQKDQKGTGHAVLQAKSKIDWMGKDIFVFVGDSPLVTVHTIRELLAYHHLTNADCTFLTSDFKMQLPYARVIKDSNGNLIRCVEEKNASKKELKVTELLSSHFIFKGEKLFSYLEEIEPDSDNGEYYLTDILDLFLRNNLKVETLTIDHYEELVGLNTPEEVAWAEEILNQREHGKY
jgi:bifunctional N-acetylglucosamine-1-phosphate-uridyltransferase/glucosamine-1-phosphate-acetyltransferase GlmU-like protein